MLNQALFLLVLVFHLMLSVLADSAANSNIYVQCSEHYFTSKTPYESNVNSLFTSIIDSSSIYNFNKFEISTPKYSQNDVVYGLFQCRGDLSSPNCKDCVTNSISQLKTKCPSSTGGGIQLDGCFVKYDNSSFFGAEDKMEVVKTCGHSIGYNSDVLNRIDGALAYLITGNGQYFRAGDYGSIEGVAQCVQDLSVINCQDCLKEACGRLRSECETSAWGNMYLGKCYITYVDQGNDSHGYNGSSSSNKSSVGGNISEIMKWIAIILGSLAGVAGASYVAKVSIRNCCNTTNITNIDKRLGKVEEKQKKQPEETKKVIEEEKRKFKEEIWKKKEEKKDDKEKPGGKKMGEMAPPYYPCIPPPNYPYMPPPNYPCMPPPNYHYMPREKPPQNEEEDCTIM